MRRLPPALSARGTILSCTMDSLAVAGPSPWRIAPTHTRTGEDPQLFRSRLSLTLIYWTAKQGSEATLERTWRSPRLRCQSLTVAADPSVISPITNDLMRCAKPASSACPTLGTSKALDRFLGGKVETMGRRAMAHSFGPGRNRHRARRPRPYLTMSRSVATEASTFDSGGSVRAIA